MITSIRDDRKPAPPQKPKSTHQAELSPAAGVLLELLRRRSRGWRELSRAGYDPINLPAATRKLTQAGHEILIGPVRVVLGEHVPEAFAV
jgi:hypothetical protein